MEHIHFHLHPLVVHFPIALFISAVIFEAAAFILRKESFHQAAVYIYVLAGVMTPLAVYTGMEEAAHEHLKHPIADLHRSLALGVMGTAFVSLPLLRVVHRRFARYFRFVFMVFLISLAVLVALTAYNGGRLVYEYGIGVEL
jgi:uncharacterized membrane protein